MLYWLYVCICLRLLIWNAGRSHVKKIPSAKKWGAPPPPCPSPSAAYGLNGSNILHPAIWTNMLGQSKSALVPELRHGVHNRESFCKYLAVYFCFSAVWTV